MLPRLTFLIDNFRDVIVGGDAITAIVEMLQAPNTNVRTTATELLERFSQQGLLLISSIVSLMLTTISDDVRALFFTPKVFSSLVKILEVDDDDARKRAVDLFRAVARHRMLLARLVLL